jgi:hypothetical protein
MDAGEQEVQAMDVVVENPFRHLTPEARQAIAEEARKYLWAIPKLDPSLAGSISGERIDGDRKLVPVMNSHKKRTLDAKQELVEDQWLRHGASRDKFFRWQAECCKGQDRSPISYITLLTLQMLAWDGIIQVGYGRRSATPPHLLDTSATIIWEPIFDSHTGKSFYGWNFVKVLLPEKFNRAMAIIAGPVNGTQPQQEKWEEDAAIFLRHAGFSCKVKRLYPDNDTLPARALGPIEYFYKQENRIGNFASAYM